MRFRDQIRHQHEHERTMMIIILIAAIGLAVVSCGNAQSKGHLVTETYIVQAGDTLDDISYRYMAKSSMPRDVREFREGIIELNWDDVFAGRDPGLIYPGDCLKINYWVEQNGP